MSKRRCPRGHRLFGFWAVNRILDSFLYQLFGISGLRRSACHPEQSEGSRKPLQARLAMPTVESLAGFLVSLGMTVLTVQFISRVGIRKQGEGPEISRKERKGRQAGERFEVGMLRLYPFAFFASLARHTFGTAGHCLRVPSLRSGGQAHGPIPPKFRGCAFPMLFRS